MYVCTLAHLLNPQVIVQSHTVNQSVVLGQVRCGHSLLSLRWSRHCHVLGQVRCGHSLLSLRWSRHCHAVQWHNIEQSTSVRLACYTVCSFVGLTAATQFSVLEFLKKHGAEFVMSSTRKRVCLSLFFCSMFWSSPVCASSNPGMIQG